MKSFQLQIGARQINYIHPLSDEGKSAVMLENIIPEENETFGNLTKEEYQKNLYRLDNLSKRNEKEVFEIPLEKEVVLLNFIPQKTVLIDTNINYLEPSGFTYFTIPDDSASVPVPFSLPEGSIFRVVGDGVKDPENYTYYIILNNSIQLIPNTKTAEVMMAERELTYESVRVIETKDFDELVASLGPVQ